MSRTESQVNTWNGHLFNTGHGAILCLWWSQTSTQKQMSEARKKTCERGAFILVSSLTEITRGLSARAFFWTDFCVFCKGEMLEWDTSHHPREIQIKHLENIFNKMEIWLYFRSWIYAVLNYRSLNSILAHKYCNDPSKTLQSQVVWNQLFSFMDRNSH